MNTVTPADCLCFTASSVDGWDLGVKRILDGHLNCCFEQFVLGLIVLIAKYD